MQKKTPKYILIGLMSINILFILSITGMALSEDVNHTSLKPFIFSYLYIIFAITSFIVFLFKRKNSLIVIFTIFISMLGIFELFIFDRWNVLVNYEEWLFRGMPEKWQKTSFTLGSQLSEPLEKECKFNNFENELLDINDFHEARDIIKENCGEADRDVGSGVYILEWYLSDRGKITLHQLNGISYQDAEGVEYNFYFKESE